MTDADLRSTLLAAYDDQLRTDAEMQLADQVRRIGPVLAGRFDGGTRGFVSYHDLAGLADEPLDELIDEVIDQFATDARVRSFEWKTRGHDLPTDLPERLLRRGLVPEEVETVMVGEAIGVAAGPEPPAGVVVRQAGADGHDRHDDLLRAYALQRRVFGHDGMGSVERLEQRLDTSSGGTSFWLALGDDEVVCAGRIDIVPGTGFAGIWGGATDPAYRGRGIYRALTAARARWAIERGVRYLHSDSTDMSRPILERSGLVAVTTTTPYIWSRPE